MKVHFIGVARSPEVIADMRSAYLTSLYNTLGGEWGVAGARDASDPLPWMDAKHKAMDEAVRAGGLTAKEAWNATVVVTNE